MVAGLPVPPAVALSAQLARDVEQEIEDFVAAFQETPEKERDADAEKANAELQGKQQMEQQEQQQGQQGDKKENQDEQEQDSSESEQQEP